MTNPTDILTRLSLDPENSGAYSSEWIDTAGPDLESRSPIDGRLLGTVRMADTADYDDVVYTAHKTFPKWRMLPAPQRGAIVREIADELRKHKDDLGALVSLEMGKILAEGPAKSRK